jgi:hypothetical protein
MKKSKGGLVVPEGAVTLSTPHATLALFAYSDVKPDTADCLLRDLRLWPNVVYARISNDALIPRSRSRMASDFLRAKRENVGDVLLMVDHDMVWEQGDLVYLAEKALETKAVVAGIYSKRDFNGGVAVRFSAPGTYTIGEDVLAPAQYVSTGFIGIHRSVLEKMAETLAMTIGNFWPFFWLALTEHPIDKTACEGLSEDWAFCARASNLGIPVYAAMKPRLVHVGDYGYRLIDSQASPPPDVNVSFSVRDETPIPAVAGLVKDVAEYTGIAPDGVHGAISEARQGLAGLWHSFGSHKPKAENAWYRRGDVGRHNLLDLVGWHISVMGPIMAEHLPGISDQRILDFGSGIGTMALALASQGNEVDCIEINKELRDFAKFRASRFLNGARPPRFVTSPDGEYDIVIAWHVFEHLPNPEAKLKELVGALKPGGRMWSDSDWVADAGHPMHHERQDWEEKMVEAGLNPVGASWYEKV